MAEYMGTGPDTEAVSREEHFRSYTPGGGVQQQATGDGVCACYLSSASWPFVATCTYQWYLHVKRTSSLINSGADIKALAEEADQWFDYGWRGYHEEEGAQVWQEVVGAAWKGAEFIRALRPYVRQLSMFLYKHVHMYPLAIQLPFSPHGFKQPNTYMLL